ncbi:hypothetical protein AWB71_06010 [Caballeronia peredens]|nr:hypothetical protein AWB71_06010 [Caballeronia peredens]
MKTLPQDTFRKIISFIATEANPNNLFLDAEDYATDYLVEHDLPAYRLDSHQTDEINKHLSAELQWYLEENQHKLHKPSNGCYEDVSSDIDDCYDYEI